MFISHNDKSKTSPGFKPGRITPVFLALLACSLAPIVGARMPHGAALTEPPAAGQQVAGGAGGEGRVVYADDFRSQRRWREGTSGACKTSYGDGGFIVENVPPPGSCEFDLLRAGSFHGNVRIEVTAQLRRGELNGGYGLKFGNTSPDGRHYFTFVFSGSGGYALSEWNGAWNDRIPGTLDPNVRKGYRASNHLAVEIRGRTIRCYVNGKYVGFYDAADEVRGTIGLNLDVVGMAAVFSDVRVLELPNAPDGGAAPPLTSGRVIFKDDFVSEQNWPTLNDEFCRTFYGEGGFVVENVASQGTCEFTLDKVGHLPENVRMEATVALVKGSTRSSFGLKFGRPVEDNNLFYTFTVNADGAFRLSQLDKEWRHMIDWTVEPGLKNGYGAANRLAIEIRGRTIRCFLNDKHVGTSDATTGVRGDTGLFLARPGMEVVFRDLRVVELSGS